MNRQGSRISAEPGTFSRQIYLLIVSTLMIAALMFAAGRSMELLDGFQWPTRVNWVFASAMVISTLLFWTVSSVAWRSAVRLLAGVDIPLKSCFAQIALVLAGKYIPGKFWGMALRGKELMNRGVDMRLMLMSSYAEQVISIHAGLVVGGLGWALIARPQFWHLISMGLLLSIVAGSPLNNILVKSSIGVINRIRGRDTLHSYTIPTGIYLRLFSLYVLEWILVGFILVSMAGLLLDFTLVKQYAIYLVAVNSLAFVAGFVAVFSPGGLGVREGVLVALLTPVLGLSEALVLSVAFRVWLIVVDSLAGLMSVKIISGQNRGLS